jgi:phage/plasmid-like protein (TIGR03299 family)
MSHFFDSGFTAHSPSWHKLEEVLDEAPDNWNDAREAAKLTWEPELRPQFTTRYVPEFKLCTECHHKLGQSHSKECEVGLGENRMKVELEDCVPDGAVIGKEGIYVFLPDPNHQQVLRNDTFALIETGLSKDFSLIFHGKDQGGPSMEQIIETFVPLGVKFDTTGSAKGGGLVWAVMYLDEPFKVPGDDSLTVPYMALLNSHNGEGACKLTYTQVRVVCANTWQMASAYGDQSGHQLVFRHVGDVEARIDQAQQSIADLREESKQFLAMAEVMSQVKSSDKLLDAYLSEFIPNPAENGEQVSDRVQENIEKARSMVKFRLFDSGTCEGIEDTMFGVVQASTEYLDHDRKYRSKDTYMGRTILKAEPLKARLLGIAGGIFHDGLVKVKDPWAEQLIQLGEQEKARSLAARPMAVKR